MTKSWDEDTIRLFNLSILEDQFDDVKQNDSAYDGQMSGIEELKSLCARTEMPSVLNVGAGGSHLDFLSGSRIHNLEPAPSRDTDLDTKIEGWCENIETNTRFDGIVCWGTFCFVRSVPESLIQFNRRLCQGGHLILDTVSFTTCPLAQTVHPDCFVRYADLFGFGLEIRLEFGPWYHRREGYHFRKYNDFDHRRLMMPQSKGEINNFLEERDWYLR